MLLHILNGFIWSTWVLADKETRGERLVLCKWMSKGKQKTRNMWPQRNPIPIDDDIVRSVFVGWVAKNKERSYLRLFCFPRTPKWFNNNVERIGGNQPVLIATSVSSIPGAVKGKSDKCLQMKARVTASARVQWTCTAIHLLWFPICYLAK